MEHSRLYRDGKLVEDGFPLDAISDHLAEDGAVLWVDLCLPRDREELQRVAAELGLHDLAVEDAVDAQQRPKLDHYATHEFFNGYAVELDPASGRLATCEVAAFVTPKALVTVRREGGFDIAPVVARWDENAELTRYGVGALVHGLVDHLVDGHFEAVRSLDEELEKLEDLLFDDRPHDKAVQRRSFQLRKSLVLMRRVILPMREVVNSLMRRDNQIVTDDLAPYYEDVYDHVLRVTEWTESLRDLVTTILETNLTIQGNRLNVITKKVTSWAAIIAVPTAVTGFYGQNVPYPGFGRTAGFIASSVVIVVLSGLLYRSFRRRDWL
jgi:magnesium transporter